MKIDITYKPEVTITVTSLPITERGNSIFRVKNYPVMMRWQTELKDEHCYAVYAVHDKIHQHLRSILKKETGQELYAQKICLAGKCAVCGTVERNWMTPIRGRLAFWGHTAVGQLPRVGKQRKHRLIAYYCCDAKCLEQFKLTPNLYEVENGYLAQ